MSRAMRFASTALATAATALLLAAGASAATFTVNDTGDVPDAALNGFCETATQGQCTLRAAVQEAQSTATTDLIGFSSNPFNGGGAATIALGSSLPVITQPVAIAAGNCGSSTAPKPCAGIDADGQANALSGSAAGVAISGLSLGGSSGPIVAWSGNRLKLENAWLGIGLNGSALPGLEGLQLSGDLAQIGGPTVAQRTVFGFASSTGLRIVDGDNNTVAGSYFGVKSDGLSPAPNGSGAGDENIEVVGSGVSGPSGNLIGATVAGSDLFSTACDGGCNVIANSPGDAIDLSGEGGETPADRIAVEGNFVGLTADGGIAASSSGAGVRVGGADEVTIGGGLPGDRNYIFAAGSGATGISQDAAGGGTGSDDLLVRGNQIGLGSAGAGPPAGASAAPAGLLSGNPSRPASFTRNRLAADPAAGAALELTGDRAAVTGNIFGVGTGGEDLSSGQIGILVLGDGTVIGGGGTGDMNMVANASGPGILLTGASSSLVSGNLVGTDSGGSPQYGNAGPGIAITGPPGSATGNTIGGGTETTENVISANAGPAIQISGDGNDRNTVTRNRGGGNAGIFIDLVPVAGPGVSATGANNAIGAPHINPGATTEFVSGSSLPFARIRLYRTPGLPGGAPDRIEAQVGEAIADASGNWVMTCPGGLCPAPIDPGQLLTATQTDLAGNTSELSLLSPYADVTPPNTTIKSGPKGRISKRQARYRFLSTEAGSSFQCKLDKRKWRKCRSPRRYRHLALRRHTFKVRAIDPAGNRDLTPARRRFTIVEAR